jgi:hypothetical protein
MIGIVDLALYFPFLFPLIDEGEWEAHTKVVKMNESAGHLPKRPSLHEPRLLNVSYY